MISLLMNSSHTALRVLSGVGILLGQTTFDGKWVFVGALVLVLIWLIVMPKRFAGHEQATPPWWRNVRIWAIVVCVIQIVIYWRFG